MTKATNTHITFPWWPLGEPQKLPQKFYWIDRNEDGSFKSLTEVDLRVAARAIAQRFLDELNKEGREV